MTATLTPPTTSPAPSRDIHIRPSHQVAAELTRLLADTYALYNATQVAHWNVEGSNFVGLHTLFEEQYRNLAETLDVAAERIRGLGFFASGSLDYLQRYAEVTPAPVTGAPDALLHALLEGHAVVRRRIQRAIELAKAADDEGTVDYLVGRLRWHDKAIWMLRSCHHGPSATLEIERDGARNR